MPSTITRESLAELLETLVRIPSVTGEESAIADWVAARLRERAAGECLRSGASVVWRGPRRGRPLVVLAGHLATVPPHGSAAIGLEGGRLHGRGASASVIFTDNGGRRWRLPKGDPAFDGDAPIGPCRVDREVATERDLFNAHGTFYELPAENAGGFAKIRPVATHNRQIHDYCSYRGLFLMTGVANDAAKDSPYLIHADDGKAALWAGAIDDVWKLGKPRGKGGPWLNTPVKAGQPSDPYLMTAYDRKSLTLSHDAKETVAITVQVDLTGDGLWVTYCSFDVVPGKPIQHTFPGAFSAYWVRTVASRDCQATAQLIYQ